MSAEEKAEVPASPSSPASSGGGGGNKVVLILTAVNVLVSIGMVAVLFLSFQKEKGQPKVEDIAAHGEEASSHGEAKDAGGGHGEAKGGGGHGAADAKAGAAKGGPDFGKMITLEQFTVNLSTPGSVTPRYVRVNISLEVPNADGEAEIAQKMPQVRNAIIDLFNSKKPGDLANIEGRDYLKEEIRNALNGFMVTSKVKGVFFTSFAVTS